MLGDVALDEQGHNLWVEPDRQQGDGEVESPFPQLRRVDVEGQGVEVDHAEEGLVLVLDGHPVLERAQVVAEVVIPRWLDARKDSGHGPSYDQRVRSWRGGVRHDTRVVRYGRSVGVSVSTPVFEGPIDLLLHLVTSHEVDILDLPLAPVVDAFVAAMNEGRDVYSLDVLSEFLLVAAILIELKSQRLLPGPDEVDAEDELIGWDERDLLLSRLLECRAYAAVADALVAMTEAASQSLPRQAGLEDGFVIHAPDLLAGVTPDKLAAAFLRATEQRPVEMVDLSHVTVDMLTVSEAVEELALELPRRRNATFAELTEHLCTRLEVIVRFLAVLELCKLGKVTLGQGSTFGQLQIDWVDEGDDLVGVGVGAIIGAGLKNDAGAVKWKKVFEIALSWIITLPAAGLIAATAKWEAGKPKPRKVKKKVHGKTVVHTVIPRYRPKPSVPAYCPPQGASG